MKVQLMTLHSDDVGEFNIPDAIFGLEPRSDILHRVVRWQRARMQQGTHKAKTRSEGNYSGRKIVAQKRTGSARHGDRNAPIFRKGGAYKGPTPRSHAHGLPKKIRKLGLKHALSAKARDGQLAVLENAILEEGKTSVLAAICKKKSWKKVLIIDGPAINENFARAARNLPEINILSPQGANVYDILRHKQLVITSAGYVKLEARLS